MPAEESIAQPGAAQPAEPPAIVSEEDGTFRVTIAAPRRRRLLVLLLLAASWWGVATAHALVRFFTPVQPGGDPHWFTLPGLALWLLGLLAIDALFYMLSGRELISIDGTLLTIVCEAPFYVLTRRFDLTHVGSLQAAPAVPVGRVLIGNWDLAHAAAFVGLTGSRVVFDYDFLSHHFGAGLDEQAAQQLAAELLSRFPSLGRPRPWGDA